MWNKKTKLLLLLIGVLTAISFAFTRDDPSKAYVTNYLSKLDQFKTLQQRTYNDILQKDLTKESGRNEIRKSLEEARFSLKAIDFWLRYLEPVAYKKINGPLPVEWETEVFEKFEAPYKREGAGLTLAMLRLDEKDVHKDTLLSLVRSSIKATETFCADSITANFKDHHAFFLCNRLFLLNLAAIYTTGFECPDTSQVIPELRFMLNEVGTIYSSYNKSFPETSLISEYTCLYQKAIEYCNNQPSAYSRFDHFSFIRNYINPLFLLNQKMIARYKVVSKSMMDYTLNKKELAIFDKGLYSGHQSKGIFLRVYDENVLAEISKLGKLLFYDPILSGNNKRSCASCHHPGEYFTDTIYSTALNYNGKDYLTRNTPSLINAQYNHLLMLDGKHISLQDQGKAVIGNPEEMNCDPKEVLRKILSCDEYKKGFTELLKYTPTEKEIGIEHITSALSFYYTGFSRTEAPFDKAMNGQDAISEEAVQGFNIFMSKAQCGTCHFVPQFNGVKPPYAGSEFEVLGVPADTTFKKISDDKGRSNVNPAFEMLNAFRTGTVRNAEYTKPYMHNGVFRTLEQVIDFYDKGGGKGKGLHVENQTLSSDSLKLTTVEKIRLIQFIHSLSEPVNTDMPPVELPKSKIKSLNTRKPGGEY